MYHAEWVNTTESKLSLQLETLKARLSSSQSHLSKESIRQSYLALSSFHKKQGDYQNSVRCLLSSRDYCTTNMQIASVCIDIMEVGILWRNYVYVHTYYTKAKHTNDLFASGGNNELLYKLEAAEGLALMCEGNYNDACHKFLQISSDATFPTLLSQEDVVLYIALLALATMSRKDLQVHLLDNNSFQQRCREFTPLHIQDALKYYSRADYGSCLNALQSYKPLLLLDVYLREHMETLYQRIVQRSVVTYFQPYSCVSIPKMANTFQMNVDQMEDLVESLFLSNLGDQSGKNTQKQKKGTASSTSTNNNPHEQLRIHSRDAMIRQSNTTNQIQRKQLQRNVTDMLCNFQQMTTSMMLRLSCLENDLIVIANDFSDNDVRVVQQQRKLDSIVKDIGIFDDDVKDEVMLDVSD